MKEGQAYCVIDCRVSDPQQLKGGSLDNQEAIGRLLAAKMGYEIARIFKKPHSATTTERDDIREIIDFIKTDPRNIRFYLIKSLDRLTREGYTEYIKLKEELEALNITIVDSEGIIQEKKNTLEHLGTSYEWSIHAPSEANEMMMAYRAKAEVRDILTRMIGAEIKLVQDGYSVRRPPDGLRNRSTLVDGKKKIIREADPARAPYFQKMFEMLRDGADYDVVVKRLNAMGFRTNLYNRWDRHDKEHPRIVGQKGGKPLTVKQLQRYILQTEYAGINTEKWTKAKGPIKLEQFDGIVSVDTFNRANRGKVYLDVSNDGLVAVRYNYSQWSKIKRFKNNPLYPWKCLLCPFCKCEMLASAAKGKLGTKYGGYHCGGFKNGKRFHKYYRVSQVDFEQNVESYLDGLKFEANFLAGLELHLLSTYRQREKEILVESSAISRSVSDLKSELAKKLDAFGFAESQTVRRMLEDQISSLDMEIKNAESERTHIEFNEKSIKAFRVNAEKLMEHPAEIIKNEENLTRKRYLLGLFFEELPTYQDILNKTPKLTPLFKLSEDFKVNKSQMVSPLYLKWNTIESIVYSWDRAFSVAGLA